WPMYLETEKGQDESGQEWDAINLRVLRELENA
ncbi:MAG: deoxyribonuclease IV, partial [Planctomycetota bacterium]